LLDVPPRIDAPTPAGRAALGYLHANCGACHTAGGELSSLRFALDYPLVRPAGAAPALATSLGAPSRYRVPNAPATVERLCAGHPDLSVIVARMSSRNPLVQMPPLATRIVDDTAVALIRRWIAEDLGGTGTGAGAGPAR
jgi:mono/diheme cytochrome c family protein